MPETILITGANRGIGLELTRQFAAAGWRVFATCRRLQQAPELAAVAASNPQVSLHPLEVTDPESIRSLQQELGEVPLDLLFHNAGIIGSQRQGFGEAEAEPWLQAFRVNSIAPLLLTQAFVDQVAASRRKLIAIMGTQMASLADNRSGGYYLYRSSKAAAHMVAKCLAIDLQPRGITVVVLHPGWVRTEMGGEAATLSPAESARGLRQVIDGLSSQDSGRFFTYAGEELPW
ncbi:MAG: SDR family oxidoreductase [Desulfuromonadales bacterium]|nr:SDR family oxidoreductase [Desulfuromonadales bacterium]